MQILFHRQHKPNKIHREPQLNRKERLPVYPPQKNWNEGSTSYFPLPSNLESNRSIPKQVLPATNISRVQPSPNLFCLSVHRSSFLSRSNIPPYYRPEGQKAMLVSRHWLSTISPDFPFQIPLYLSSHRDSGNPTKKASRSPYRVQQD